KACRTILGYEEGFEALDRGDYHRAADILGRAAVATGFASDLINHAYTLALYRAGEHAQLADIAFRIGRGLLDTDPASAMDYFQRAIVSGLDGSRVRLIGEIHEEWAGEQRRSKLAGEILRIGHVASALIPGLPLTQYLKVLVDGFETRGIESTIFT